MDSDTYFTIWVIINTTLFILIPAIFYFPASTIGSSLSWHLCPFDMYYIYLKLSPMSSLPNQTGISLGAVRLCVSPRSSCWAYGHRYAIKVLNQGMNGGIRDIWFLVGGSRCLHCAVQRLRRQTVLWKPSSFHLSLVIKPLSKAPPLGHRILDGDRTLPSSIPCI